MKIIVGVNETTHYVAKRDVRPERNTGVDKWVVGKRTEEAERKVIKDCACDAVKGLGIMIRVGVNSVRKFCRRIFCRGTPCRRTFRRRSTTP